MKIRIGKEKVDAKLGNIERLNMSDIKVPMAFRRAFPSEEKMQACRDYYQQKKCIDREIIIDANNYIVDGYVGYLVLLENNIRNTRVIRIVEEKKNYKNSPTMYVFGHHPHGGKTYVWRMVSKTQNPEWLRIGAKMLVNTKRGTKLVVVDDFKELSEPPVSMPVKKVIRCLEN